MSAALDAPLGRLGRYELLARLGGGGMAEVFRAKAVGAEGFSRTVAIKRVLPGYSDNPAFASMFVSEAQVCSRMQHPNVVSVIDFDRDHERRLFLVMELVEGADLDGLLETGVLPPSVIVYITSEILRGLGYAHDLPDGGVDATGRPIRGVVHRDVSPHNVLVSWEGAIKVSDFGIAKARAQSAATASAMIKGKPAYMSPEQANGNPIDGRSDLFAVGIILWEMLTGQRLFVGDTREALAQVFFKQIPRPSEIRSISPDLEAVALKLLARDIQHRYARAEDAIDDLAACVDAPRDGRSELVRLLAERFARAPKTTRTGRTPPKGASAPQAGGRAVAFSPPPLLLPAAAGVIVSSPTSPTLGTASDRPPLRRWPIAIALGALTVVAAAITIAVAGGGKSNDQANAADDARQPTVVLDAAVVAPALPAAVDAATAAADARPATPPPVDAKPAGRTNHRSRPHGPRAGSADKIHEVEIGDN